MKKILFLIVVTVYLTGCATYGRKGTVSPGPAVPGAPETKNTDEKVNDWLDYSYGLHYKLYALNNPDDPGRSSHLNKALEYFMKSASSGKDLDRVYFHISDCYYHLYNFPKSLEYARKSIEINPRYLDSYNRMYNIYMRLKNNAAAADVLEKYCSANPGSIEIQFVLAEHYLKKMNDPEKSKAAFQKVLDITRESANEIYYREYTCYYLGYIAYQQNKIDEATGYYESAYEINSSNLKAVYMLAFLHMEQYHLDRAEKYATLYLNTYPGNYVMNSIMGRLLYLKDDNRAAGYLRIGRNDKSVNGIIARGLYLEITGKNGDAREILKSVEKYSPNSITPHIALARISGREKDGKSQFNELITAGVLAYRAGLLDVGRKCFTEAVAIDDTVMEAYYYLGRIYEDMGKYSLALVNYKKVDKMKPSVELTLHIGYVYGLNKNYRQAFVYFDRVTEKEPENSQPYFYRGIISMWDRNYPVAEKNMLRAIELDDQQESYYFYLAVIFEKSDKINEAILSLEKALEQSPDSARLNNYLGYLYADRNMNVDRSMALVMKALEKEPGNGAYLDSLGWVYYRKGMYNDALKKLLEAEKQLDVTETPDPVVYDHIGDAYEKLGNRDKAVRYWQKSLDMEDSSKIRDKIKGHKGGN